MNNSEIAQEVMGLVPCIDWRMIDSERAFHEGCDHGPGECYPKFMPMNYLKYDSAAFMVVDRMRERGYAFEMDIDDVGTHVHFWKKVDDRFEGYHETNRPKAICIAALSAVRKENGDG